MVGDVVVVVVVGTEGVVFKLNSIHIIVGKSQGGRRDKDEKPQSQADLDMELDSCMDKK